MKHWIAAALTCATFSAQALTIGSFGQETVNYWGAALATGAEYDQLRAEFQRRGDTVVSLNQFTADNLAGIDVFYTSLPDTVDRQSVEELSALKAWVEAGGTFISAGEYENSFGRYNNLLSPFGVTLVTDLPYWGNASVENVVSPILQGPNGTVSNFGFYAAGGFSGDGLEVLAREAGAPILVRKAVGLGQVIAIGDQNLFTDTYIGAGEKTLFLNMLDSSVAAVPEPHSAAMMATGLAGMIGWTAWRRRRVAGR